ncbi:isoflavone reductase homolog PCBER isoform X2 [Brachypodium distachyon]|uniref:NmrA-like domain-containing protein n=1 Tax=Brachypodium distachyon TaxID=15368 RepID=A0A0Q3FVQ0_BRADI|nr:isoflavone reductase homolog PCBER isoform X2 [Brachypodium distachyon]KQK03496.1 hypothetical protein BRADI_2g08230v3 [Brachypodium distachyon]|eukprot:XP_003565549.1 isoflavone reductase homolog PCBER isoform X2 [Brachypodium distachyon]
MSSRILVIGGTGNIGQHLVTASLDAGHPTALLVRRATVASDSGKAKLLKALVARGATLVYGDVNDHGSLVAAIKEHGEVVICAVGHGRPEELDGQLNIIQAIKEAAGYVKRFVPSEFGCDVEHAERTLEPAKGMIASKLRVRRAIRDAGIPHTIICSYWAIGLLLSRLVDFEEDGPLTAGANILGDDKSRAIFVDEKDTSMLTIRAVEDPRTLNKVMYVRPPTNMRSFGQLVELLEKKTGKTLERHFVSEHELAKKIQESPFPLNFQLAMVHSTVVHPGACEEAVDAAVKVEATLLYPDVEFITVEEYLDGLLT